MNGAGILRVVAISVGNAMLLSCYFLLVGAVILFFNENDKKLNLIMMV